MKRLNDRNEAFDGERHNDDHQEPGKVAADTGGRAHVHAAHDRR